ncbi:S-adenosyl-L-methionine-dependent methyltransferase [Schizopora paradoxa]|uniref:S-adenosyl-L-methionine-dependent methyltransferase n=1 Tax=Schizopora paradoxa TaxID=27342 RepID=A0A0H2RP60_9AGAM|nr:S-adenosyl-L-methionine-dependent methyltransferase [Schizopora paradoxa]
MAISQVGLALHLIQGRRRRLRELDFSVTAPRPLAYRVENEEMTNDTYLPGAKYVLPYTRNEFERLNLQHKYLSKTVCDGRLIFDTTIDLDEKSCVLDSGTGTGIWAINLAKELPESVEVHALDISDTNFAPDHPNNVHFSVASVTSLPSGWADKFDFVNQRYLVGALLAKEWPVVLSEFYRVLKPGGAVQLIEIDLRSPTPETPISVQTRDAKWKAFDTLGLDYGVAGNLAKLLESAGFVEVVDEIRRLPLGKTWGEIGVQGTISIGGAFRNASESLVKAGALSSNEEYESLMDKLEAEWDLHGTSYACNVVCARKPSRHHTKQPII